MSDNVSSRPAVCDVIFFSSIDDGLASKRLLQGLILTTVLRSGGALRRAFLDHHARRREANGVATCRRCCISSTVLQRVRIKYKTDSSDMFLAGAGCGAFSDHHTIHRDVKPTVQRHECLSFTLTDLLFVTGAVRCTSFDHHAQGRPAHSSTVCATAHYAVCQTNHEGVSSW